MTAIEVAARNFHWSPSGLAGTMRCSEWPREAAYHANTPTALDKG